jgi:hypothetical protein
VESSLGSDISGGYINLLNDPPSPRKDFLQLPATTPLSIPVSSLLANDLDLEGNPAIFSLATSRTRAGGTVTLVNGILTYAAPANPPGRGDSFSYVLTDSFGSSELGTVILLSSNSIPRLIGLERSRNSLVVRFRGLPETSYMLQSRPDLQAVSGWLDFPDALQPLMQKADTNGNLQFEIPISSGIRSFERLMWRASAANFPSRGQLRSSQ